MNRTETLQFIKSQLSQADLGSLYQSLCANFAALPSYSAENLINVYEDLITPEKTKKEGIFYTPIPTARHMARLLLGGKNQQHNPQENLEFTVCDPACGGGCMLVSFVRELIGNTSTTDTIRERATVILTQVIHGVDIDSAAVAVCRVALLLTYVEIVGELPSETLVQTMQNSIRVGDSLLEESAQKFDYLICNPPYGLSRDGRIDAETNTRLKERYQSYQLGKTNHYLLFMARTLELLSDSGSLCLIVPNSWLGIRSARVLRKKFLIERLLRRIDIFDYPVFKEPGVEAVIYCLSKRSEGSSIMIYHHTSIEHEPVQRASIDHALCLDLPDATIPSRVTAEDLTLISQILQNSVALGSDESFFSPMIALQAYAQGRGVPPQTDLHARQRSYHATTKQNESYFPYLEGKDVGRFALQWSGNFLSYGPWLAEPQILSRFQGPRVVIREVTGRMPQLLRATTITDCYLYNKSILHILLKPGVEENAAWALTALLNSSLAAKIIYLLGRKTQRKLFPKIVNDDLLTFPLSKNFTEFIPSLSSLAKELSTEVASSQQPTPRIAELNAQLDDLVMECYQIERTRTPVLCPH